MISNFGSANVRKMIDHKKACRIILVSINCLDEVRGGILECS